MALVLKTSEVQASVGSNPTLSVSSGTWPGLSLRLVPKKLSLLITRRRPSAPIARGRLALIPEFSAAQPIGERLQWIRRSRPLSCRR